MRSLCVFDSRLLWVPQVPAGTKEPRPPNSSPAFISTPSQAQLLAEMMTSHMVKDICLIGAKVANANKTTKQMCQTKAGTVGESTTLSPFRVVGSR